jgi:hypothetical protein
MVGRFPRALPWAVEYDPFGVGDGNAVASCVWGVANAGSVGNVRRAIFRADPPDAIKAPHCGHHRALSRFAMPVRSHRTVPIHRKRAAPCYSDHAATRRPAPKGHDSTAKGAALETETVPKTPSSALNGRHHEPRATIHCRRPPCHVFSATAGRVAPPGVTPLG